MRCLTLGLALCAVLSSRRVEAQAIDSPYHAEMRAHFYRQLAKSPWRALGWELLFPGAGNYYSALYAPAAATLALSLAGASLWFVGAVREHSVVEHVGLGTFAAARTYGVVSAPLGAVLLNAAFRRQLGIAARF
jgi:hypothetical protein